MGSPTPWDGSVAPSQIGGYKPCCLRAIYATGCRSWLVAEQGVKVDYVQIWRFAHAEGLSFKKAFFPPRNSGPGCRSNGRKFQGRPDPGRLVFVDETWARTSMAPLRLASGSMPRCPAATGRR